MKVKSERLDDGSIKFDHYKVRKKSDHYYAITDNCGVEITSGETMVKACKRRSFWRLVITRQWKYIWSGKYDHCK